jgi:hypothetical protein
MAGGKDPFEMPRDSIVDPIQARGPIHHPRQVTDGIPGIGDQWGRELDRMVAQATNEVSFRQRVAAELQASGVDSAARRELFERAIRRYRTVKADALKSQEPNSMEKALFIGPRGGRWADAAHTVPYDPEKHGPKHKQVTVRDKTGGEGKPSEALISLPQWISGRAARYIARELGLSGREEIELARNPAAWLTGQSQQGIPRWKDPRVREAVDSVKEFLDRQAAAPERQTAAVDRVPGDPVAVESGMKIERGLKISGVYRVGEDNSAPFTGVVLKIYSNQSGWPGSQNQAQAEIALRDPREFTAELGLGGRELRTRIMADLEATGLPGGGREYRLADPRFQPPESALEPKIGRAESEPGWERMPESALEPKIGRVDFEDREQARQEKFERRAERAAAEAERARKTHRGITENIPLGQPILVGHHSEKRHRRDVERAERAMRKEYEAQQRAAHYQQRASTERRGISSDDPEALVQLREKVERLESQREAIKTANKVWRRVIKKIPIPGDSEADRVNELTAERREALSEGLAREGFDDQSIQRVLAAQIHVFKFSPGSDLNSPPFPKYELTNLGARIRTAKKRAERLEAEGIRRAQAEAQAEAEGGTGESEAPEAPEYQTKRGETFTIEENLDANRVQLHFDGKPSAETRRVLKASGFRWSPREGAWQRMLNDAGRGAAESVRAQLVPPETPEAHPVEDHPAMPPEDTQREAVDLSTGIWPEGTNPEPELLPPDTLGRRKHGKWTKPVALGDLAAAVSMVPVGSGFHTRRSDSEALDEGQYYLRISPNQWAEYYGNEGARRGLMKEVLTDALVSQRLAETKYVRGFERTEGGSKAEQPQQASLFRSETPEILTVDELHKAVYVGPRGGKWADPAHKIPLRELRAQPGAQQRAKRRLDAPEQYKVARREAREAGAKVKVALRSGTAKELQAALRGLAAAQEDQVAALRAGDQDSKADRVAKRVEAVRGALWTIRGEAFGSGRELDPRKRKTVRKKLAGMLKAGLATEGPRLLVKAEPRGGKYHRRIPKPGGGYRYIYDADQYGQREDAHVKGSEASRAYVSRRVAQAVDGAGSKGVEPAALKSLVKRHGAKRVAQALRDHAENGTLAFKKGKFYPKRKAGEEDKGGE